ncbi:MAG: hypothetical protein U0837_02290 [Dehalococcoidia bacterium]
MSDGFSFWIQVASLLPPITTTSERLLARQDTEDFDRGRGVLVARIRSGANEFPGHGAGTLLTRPPNGTAAVQATGQREQHVQAVHDPVCQGRKHEELNDVDSREEPEADHEETAIMAPPTGSEGVEDIEPVHVIPRDIDIERECWLYRLRHSAAPLEATTSTIGIRPRHHQPGSVALAPVVRQKPGGSCGPLGGGYPSARAMTAFV